MLVEFSKLDKDLPAKDGKVLAHATSNEAICKALLGTRGKNMSIEYCGKTPDDVAVMFASKLPADAHRKSPARERDQRGTGHLSSGGLLIKAVRPLFAP